MHIVPRAQLDFNPRSREGSDNLCPVYHALIIHFNPRSREGSDCRLGKL